MGLYQLKNHLIFADFTIFSTFALSLGEICSRGLWSPILLEEKMITAEHITELISQQIQGTDIFLVDVHVKPGNAIRVHVDTPEGISIDECVKISRFLNESLDRDVEDFSLEVSSPGLGSKFLVKQQYDKHVDRKIEVLFTDGIKVRGRLVSVTDTGIVLRVKDDSKEIAFEEIKTAKAVIAFN
jgi:ribosome maturation factor RimP